MGLGFLDGCDCECDFVECSVGLDSVGRLVQREGMEQGDEEDQIGLISKSLLNCQGLMFDFLCKQILGVFNSLYQ